MQVLIRTYSAHARLLKDVVAFLDKILLTCSQCRGCGCIDDVYQDFTRSYISAPILNTRLSVCACIYDGVCSPRGVCVCVSLAS